MMKVLKALSADDEIFFHLSHMLKNSPRNHHSPLKGRPWSGFQLRHPEFIQVELDCSQGIFPPANHQFFSIAEFDLLNSIEKVGYRDQNIINIPYISGNIIDCL